MRTTPALTAAVWFLRLSLAGSFLSAVADRFGLWGAAGEPNVVWGNWESFLEYVAVLNWFVPAAAIPALGWAATVAEAVLAVGLIVGWRLRWVSLLSGMLLLIFAATMTAAVGIKAPLDYSVFSAAAGAFVLAGLSEKPGDLVSKPPPGRTSAAEPTT